MDSNTTTTNIIHLPNTGVMLDEIPGDMCQRVTDQALAMLQDHDAQVPYHYKLAGQMQHEYGFEPDQDLKQHLLDKAKQYLLLVMPDETEQTLDLHALYLEGCWINFQRKHEFNPLHTHDGLVSFVLWVQVPYDIEDELAMFAQAREHRNGLFEFVYNNILGDIRMMAFPVDRSWQGRLCMFPSSLAHAVHPFFSSDGVRISISGNYIMNQKTTTVTSHLDRAAHVGRVRR